jgi:hypothetical protein
VRAVAPPCTTAPSTPPPPPHPPTRRRSSCRWCAAAVCAVCSVGWLRLRMPCMHAALAYGCPERHLLRCVQGMAPDVPADARSDARHAALATEVGVPVEHEAFVLWRLSEHLGAGAFSKVRPTTRQRCLQARGAITPRCQCSGALASAPVVPVTATSTTSCRCCWRARPVHYGATCRRRASSRWSTSARTAKSAQTTSLCCAQRALLYSASPSRALCTASPPGAPRLSTRAHL